MRSLTAAILFISIYSCSTTELEVNSSVPEEVFSSEVIMQTKEYQFADLQLRKLPIMSLTSESKSEINFSNNYEELHYQLSISKDSIDNYLNTFQLNKETKSIEYHLINKWNSMVLGLKSVNLEFTCKEYGFPLNKHYFVRLYESGDSVLTSTFWTTEENWSNCEKIAPLLTAVKINKR